jgi:hypothetical protein
MCAHEIFSNAELKFGKNTQKKEEKKEKKKRTKENAFFFCKKE